MRMGWITRSRNSVVAGMQIACPVKGRWKFGLSILSSDYGLKKRWNSGRAAICVTIRREVQSCYHNLMVPLRNRSQGLLQSLCYCTKRQLRRRPTVFAYILLLSPSIRMSQPKFTVLWTPTSVTKRARDVILLVFLNGWRNHSNLVHWRYNIQPICKDIRTVFVHSYMIPSATSSISIQDVPKQTGVDKFCVIVETADIPAPCTSHFERYTRNSASVYSATRRDGKCQQHTEIRAFLIVVSRLWDET